MSGLYIHIPFCYKKCIYCDFYSVGSKNAPWELYVKALLNEFSKRNSEITNKFSTLYIGGGTPSQMPTFYLNELLIGIKDIAKEKWDVEELTIEVNPDDITQEYVDSLLYLGINRVSMGVQSFNDEELKILNRRHSVSQVYKAYKFLSAIPNISMDLIFGLPNQTLNSWESNIDVMLSLRPKHISAYSLMYEEGTPIYIMRQQGRVNETDENMSEQMFELLVSKLKASGYIQYEISNFALPGYESKHNSNYWKGVSYLGIGASAHSYDGKMIRRSNEPSYKRYINHFMSDVYAQQNFYNEEILNDEELYDEYIMTRMRMMQGIDIRELRNFFGHEKYLRFLNNSERHLRLGNIIKNGNSYSLSQKGILISDPIFVDLMK